MITSRRNPQVIEARKLSQRKHRQRQGRFLVEGVALLQMAWAAGAQPLEVFYCESMLGSGIEPEQEPRSAGPEAAAQGPASWAMLERLQQAGGQLVAVSPQVMESLAERELAEGVLATFPLVETQVEDLHFAAHDLVLVVDRLQDPGNLGTLIRTADATGVVGVVLIEPCVDPFDPKTVRGTMGSLFNVSLARTADVGYLFGWLRDHGLRVVGADAHRGEMWGLESLEGGVALVLGNEARGLSDDVYPYVESWVRLPIVGRAESLNVAVAGGVLMYTWLRVNRL